MITGREDIKPDLTSLRNCVTMSDRCKSCNAGFDGIYTSASFRKAWISGGMGISWRRQSRQMCFVTMRKVLRLILLWSWEEPRKAMRVVAPFM